jgi:hypothetical protein
MRFAQQQDKTSSLRPAGTDANIDHDFKIEIPANQWPKKRN